MTLDPAVKTRGGQVYGLWQGGVNYAASSKDDLELFASLTDAKWVLETRQRRGYSWPSQFRYVFKNRTCDLTPTVDIDSYIEVWFDLNLDALAYEDLPEPDRYVYFGPRGGLHVGRYLPDRD